MITKLKKIIKLFYLKSTTNNLSFAELNELSKKGDLISENLHYMVFDEIKKIIKDFRKQSPSGRAISQFHSRFFRPADRLFTNEVKGQDDEKNHGSCSHHRPGFVQVCNYLNIERQI